MNDITRTPGTAVDNTPQGAEQAEKSSWWGQIWPFHADDDERNDAVRNNGTAGQGARNDDRDDEDVAPVSGWMRWLGIWSERSLGGLAMVAPMVMSGWFTFHVFNDISLPIYMPAAFAFIAALALEGNTTRLTVLLSKTMLNGDSTLGLRGKLVLWLGVISGLIYWHADYTARRTTPGQSGLDNYQWIPAAAAALFSLFGVLVYLAVARHRYRNRLRAMGKVDTQAPKFAAQSWFWSPWETVQAARHAAKFRIASPHYAIRSLRDWKVADKPGNWVVPDYERIDAEKSAERAEELQRATMELVAELMEQRDTLVPPRSVEPPAPVREIGSVPEERETVRNGNDEQDEETTERAFILKYPKHLAVVLASAAYRDEQWLTRTPKVSEINDIVTAHRIARGGERFHSQGISSQVRNALIALRGHRDLYDRVMEMAEMDATADL